jgi:hypothetical protein
MPIESYDDQKLETPGRPPAGPVKPRLLCSLYVRTQTTDCVSGTNMGKSLLRQACSWLPLEITRAMLQTIMDKYTVMPEIYDLLGCFCDRTAQIEEGFCSPLRLRQSSSVCGEILDRLA